MMNTEAIINPNEIQEKINYTYDKELVSLLERCRDEILRQRSYIDSLHSIIDG